MLAVNSAECFYLTVKIVFADATLTSAIRKDHANNNIVSDAMMCENIHHGITLVLFLVRNKEFLFSNYLRGIR